MSRSVMSAEYISSPADVPGMVKCPAHAPLGFALSDLKMCRARHSVDAVNIWCPNIMNMVRALQLFLHVEITGAMDIRIIEQAV